MFNALRWRAHSALYLSGFVALVALITLFAYQTPRFATLSIREARLAGESLQFQNLIAPLRLARFYDIETQERFEYRWSNGQGQVSFPNPGGTIIVQMELAGGSGRFVAADIDAPDFAAGFIVGPEPRIYHVLLPSQAHARGQMTIHSATFRPNNEARKLGLVLGSIRIQGGGSIPFIMLVLLLTTSTSLLLGLYSSNVPIKASVILAGLGSLGMIWWVIAIGWRMPDISRIVLGFTTAIGLFITATRMITDCLARFPIVFWRSIGICAIVCNCVLLIGYMQLGSYIRYIADDYCYTNIANQHGAIEMVVGTYNLWSGRYTMTFVSWLLAPFGTTITPVLPAIWVLLWLVGLAYLLTQVAITIGLRKPILVGVLLAPPMLLTTLVRIPNIIQSFFWQIGAITYTLPLILSTVYAGWLLHIFRQQKRIKLHSVLFAGVFTLLIGGFSETHATTQLAPLGMALVFILFWHWRWRSFDKRQILVLVSAVVGAGLAIVIIAIAPGNQLRNTTLGNSLGRNITTAPLVEAADVMFWPLYKPVVQILEATSASGDLLDLPLFDIESPAKISLTAQALMVLLLLSSTLFAITHFSTYTIDRNRMLWLGIGILFCTWLCISAVIFPGYYAIGMRPPDRVYIGAQFLATGMILGFGFILGTILPQAWVTTRVGPILALGIVSIAGIIASAGLLAAQTPPMEAYAQRWSLIDTQLHAAKGADVVRFDRRAVLGELVLFLEDPAYWANICVAEFYSVGRVEVR